jgi:hypothetical protein
MALSMSSPDPTPWAVLCTQHGRVYLTEAEYRMQLNRPNVGWACTQAMLEAPPPVGRCCKEAEWDDENYEARDGSR